MPKATQRDKLITLLSKFFDCSNAKARKMMKDLEGDNQPKDQSHYQSINLDMGAMPTRKKG